ncbi:MAG: glycosyltransferase family 4 protein [Calditrichaceae bacterium]|nr:glycosyltransferase family 4 protein [Calditrichaceae bacterium]MBN2707972.1 glycosyltransferase family 4 protein [Calditrichaceae bacterium]RQV95927.1 MAG: glycosyltransferase family 1 protein [Calditrichota bacterium]
MKIALLTSYPLDVRIGSGVVQTLLSYRQAFRESGHFCTIISPEIPGNLPQDLTAFRKDFNKKLRTKDFKNFDIIIGSDFDGYLLNTNTLPPYYAINGGILADIVRFESGESAKQLAMQAELEKRNVQKARRIFVPSQYTARMVHKYYAVSHGKISVVYPGIDFGLWNNLLDSQPVLIKKTPSVLCVAKQYPRKGIADLIKMTGLLLEDRIKIKVDIVGGGPGLKENRNISKSLGLDIYITFHGDIGDRVQIAGFFKNADIFCMPSYHETFGLVYLEALASGIPVVAYDAAAVSEVIPKDCGLLCRTGNLMELKRAVKSLIENKSERIKMGRIGRAYAAQLTWERSADKIVSIINEDLKE